MGSLTLMLWFVLTPTGGAQGLVRPSRLQQKKVRLEYIEVFFFSRIKGLSLVTGREGGSNNMGKLRVQNFLHLPSRQGKHFRTPISQGENFREFFENFREFFVPPFYRVRSFAITLQLAYKIQAPALKLPNLLCAPSAWLKLVPSRTPYFL